MDKIYFRPINTAESNNAALPMPPAPCGCSGHKIPLIYDERRLNLVSLWLTIIMTALLILVALRHLGKSA
jgi:hypothetical protein